MDGTFKVSQSDLYTEDWAWGRKTDEFGSLHHLRLLADEPDFQTMTKV